MVNFVYFCGNANWNFKYYCRWNDYGMSNQSRSWYNEYKNDKGKSSTFHAGDIFYRDHVKPDQHYVYIITPTWVDIFEEELKRLNMWEYKIYESREFAENYNYPGEARLKVFVFHTPKDFVHKPTGTYDD